MTTRVRRGSTARARIVVVLVALLAATVALITAMTWAFLTARDARRVDDGLVATGTEFQALATETVDPLTGAPFTSVTTLLRNAIERSVPAVDEERFAIVDGDVLYRTTNGHPGRIDVDEDLVEHASAVTVPTLATAHTDEGPVRYLAMPVDGDDGTGTYVAAIALDHAAAEVDRIVVAVAVIGAVGLALAALVGWIVAGRLLAPLDRLRVEAAGITERDLDRRIPESGTDDIKALTGSFNTMLDRLDRAFAAQRRFAADAGHELRTPLTVLRGHTELLSDDEAVRAEQRVVLLDEIDRMTAMVEDLLALTRLDRAPELVPEPLAPVDVVDRWRLLAEGLPDRRWTWIADGPALVADPRRLHQVFLQLAQNALAVTGPGGAVEAGLVVTTSGPLAPGVVPDEDGASRYRDREPLAVLWVADGGPGIPSAERTRIFEPFARGSARTDGGSGLGLAIVAGIARAYGGSVEASDHRPVDRPEPWPGGACVTMRLPASGPGTPTRATLDPVHREDP